MSVLMEGKGYDARAPAHPARHLSLASQPAPGDKPNFKTVCDWVKQLGRVAHMQIFRVTEEQAAAGLVGFPI